VALLSRLLLSPPQTSARSISGQESFDCLWRVLVIEVLCGVPQRIHETISEALTFGTTRRLVHLKHLDRTFHLQRCKARESIAVRRLVVHEITDPVHTLFGLVPDLSRMPAKASQPYSERGKGTHVDLSPLFEGTNKVNVVVQDNRGHHHSLAELECVLFGEPFVVRRCLRHDSANGRHHRQAGGRVLDRDILVL
jgi:hypothetical protein